MLSLSYNQTTITYTLCFSCVQLTVEYVKGIYLSKRDAMCGLDAVLWSRHFCVDHQLPQVSSSHQDLRLVIG